MLGVLYLVTPSIFLASMVNTNATIKIKSCEGVTKESLAEEKRKLIVYSVIEQGKSRA